MNNLFLHLFLISHVWFGALANLSSDAQMILSSTRQSYDKEKIPGDNPAYYCGLRTDQLFQLEEFLMVPNPPPV